MRKAKINEKNESINNKTNKKKPNFIKLFIVTIVCVLIYSQLYSLVMYTLGKKDNDYLYNFITSFVNNKKETKSEDSTVKLLALGSVYASPNIIKSHRNNSSYDFTSGYDKLKDITNKYDVVLASLASPIAGSGLGYSTTKVYNSPDELALLFKYLNVSLVTCATTNMLDKNEKGVINTIDTLNKSDIKNTGINKSNDFKPVILDKNNIKIGILSYTDKSSIKSVKQKEYLVNVLNEENIKRDVKFLNDNNVDYIITYLDIDNTDAHRINANQKDLVNLLIDNKIDVIIGTGSKVVQEEVNDIVTTGEEQKHVYYIYSVGDLLGDMTTEARKTSVGVDITFTKSMTKDKKGEVIDSSVKKNMTINKPVKLYNDVTKSYKLTNYPIDITLDKYKSDNSVLDKNTYENIINSNKELEKVLIKKEGI
ncbi:MAG: CapA family protein [Clostridia bacterium]